MCFKHFKELKYYYDSTSANENEASFFLNDRYFIFYETKMTGVNKIYERQMSKLGVFLWLLWSVIVKFLQNDIDKYRECETNESTKKIHLR